MAEEIKMTEKELIYLNNRLNYIMGVMISMLFEYQRYMSGRDQRIYEWIKNAIENVFYLDKPLPPIPD